jgi:hypothetical protein
MSEALVVWLKSTSISQAMTTSQFLWPVCEALHFVGLALLVGGAGLIDVRLMGFLKSIPVAAVMQVRKWAALGVLINVITGALFFIGAPAQYIDNPAWYGKLAFLLVAIINVAIFETTQGERMLRLPVGVETPTSFKLAGAVSMGSWFLVFYFGRMLPFIGNAF